MDELGSKSLRSPMLPPLPRPDKHPLPDKTAELAKTLFEKLEKYEPEPSDKSRRKSSKVPLRSQSRNKTAKPSKVVLAPLEKVQRQEKSVKQLKEQRIEAEKTSQQTMLTAVSIQSTPLIPREEEEDEGLEVGPEEIEQLMQNEEFASYLKELDEIGKTWKQNRGGGCDLDRLDQKLKGLAANMAQCARSQMQFLNQIQELQQGLRLAPDSEDEVIYEEDEYE